MINILYLSDLHQRMSNDSKFENVFNSFFDELLNFCNKEENRIWKPKYLVISGDITSKGLSSEYDKIKDILTRINSHINIEFSNMILLPGNHDKKRGKSEENLINHIKNGGKPETVEKRLKNYDLEIDNKLKDINKRHDIFCNFNSFIEELQPGLSNDVINGWGFSNDRTQGIYTVKEENDINLVFVTINTAYYCINENLDYGRLRLDSDFIDHAKNHINHNYKKDNRIVLTIMHHNPSWLKYNERLSFANSPSNFSAIRYFSDLILTGHEHSHEYSPDFLNCEVPLLIGGATYTDDENNKQYYPNSFSIIQINENTRTFKRKNFIFQLLPGKKHSWEFYDDGNNYPLFPIIPYVKKMESVKENKDNLERENAILKRIAFKKDEYTQQVMHFKKTILFHLNLVNNKDVELFNKLFGIDNDKIVENNDLIEKLYEYDDKIFFKRVNIEEDDLPSRVNKILEYIDHKRGKLVMVVEQQNDNSNVFNLDDFNNFINNGKLMIIFVEICYTN